MLQSHERLQFLPKKLAWLSLRSLSDVEVIFKIPLAELNFGWLPPPSFCRYLSSVAAMMRWLRPPTFCRYYRAVWQQHRGGYVYPPFPATRAVWQQCCGGYAHPPSAAILQLCDSNVRVVMSTHLLPLLSSVAAMLWWLRQKYID